MGQVHYSHHLHRLVPSLVFSWLCLFAFFYTKRTKRSSSSYYCVNFLKTRLKMTRTNPSMSLSPIANLTTNSCSVTWCHFWKLKMSLLTPSVSIIVTLSQATPSRTTSWAPWRRAVVSFSSCQTTSCRVTGACTSSVWLTFKRCMIAVTRCSSSLLGISAKTPSILTWRHT